MKKGPYSSLENINGEHPFKEKVPFGYVEYRARRRKGGKVVYFNFDLAKEMGIIPKNHPSIINAKLNEALLDTFALVIINEYDMINGTRINEKDILPHTYMATRYLQLQHPDRRGVTSGDGRSIWNGTHSHNGISWDISSCGTGATCLSPATHLNNKFYKTGDPTVSYGCGYSDLSDGMSAAILSEIFHQNGISTERSLCVIEFPHGTSINVRAGKNLLRPSHFFNHLKQGQYERLKNVVDFYIQREFDNGTWKKSELKAPVKDERARYNFFLTKINETFAKMAAQFECEYIFCWLDWDGDNILANGGIIDYGSVRQFGLFHHEYRYDDTERWSTNILEQKKKAKYIVQTYLQAIDFLLTKKKKNIKEFQKHSLLKKFEGIFYQETLSIIARKVGASSSEANYLLTHKKKSLVKFYQIYSKFERETSPIGLKKVADGVNNDAVFCMRDILRVLPKYLADHGELMKPEDFLTTIRSQYARKKNLDITSARVKEIQLFQESYLELIQEIASHTKRHMPEMLSQVSERSHFINKYSRVTGDAIIHITDKVLRVRNQLNSQELHKLIDSFIVYYLVPTEDQLDQKRDILKSMSQSSQPQTVLPFKALGPKAKSTFVKMNKIVRNLRYSI